MTLPQTETAPDSPEVREYNRIHRRLQMLDFLLGLALLIVLLVTGWTNTLRDWAYHGAFQNYTLAVFCYVGMLVVISKVLGSPIDYYSFRLEHEYGLSNQKTGSWIWDR